jgi:16S rRNA (uracil1498-N3)-methyltransferase
VNLILLLPEDLDDTGKRAQLRGRRLAHVANIQRAQVGDVLAVGLLNGWLGRGRVSRLSDTLDLELEITDAPAPPLRATLILALPRPLILKRALHAATTLGVKKIILLAARRVERSFWQSKALRPEAVREQLILGLEQARDTVLPEVTLAPHFRPFVEGELPGLLRGRLGLVAHPGAPAPCPRGPLAEPLTLAIGPEGGFNDFEIEKLAAAGLAPVQIGERILRVDAAVSALLGRLF